MNVDIICPLYNGAKYIENLHASLLMQKNVEINSIQYIITNTNDETVQQFLDKNPDLLILDTTVDSINALYILSKLSFTKYSW